MLEILNRIDMRILCNSNVMIEFVNLKYLSRIQDRFRTNRDAANYLKKYLDKRYPWLEWIVIAYNNKNKNEQDTRAAYYDLRYGHKVGGLSRGMIDLKYLLTLSYKLFCTYALILSNIIIIFRF